MPSSRTPPADDGRPYHHGHLRDSLVEAGLDLARTGGPDAVVLRAVSRAAGVSHNAAYRHFADHEALLAAVGARCGDALADLMVRRTAEVRAREPRRRAWARLEAIGRAYIEFARTEPGWFRTAFAGTGPPPDDPDGADALHPRHRAAAGEAAAPGPFALLSARLDELVEAGAMPRARRPGAEYAAWAAVHGLSTLLVEGPLQGLPDAEVERAVTTVVQVVRGGLRT